MYELNDVLAKFQEIAMNPDKQLKKHIAEGKRVVICAPVYTPDEIIHSMGMIPMGAWGADIEINEAKRYFPAFICSIMQSILELGIRGVYSGVCAIIIPSLCDSLKCLGENWKYAVPDIPFIPMTYPQNRADENGRRFTRVGYERVIRDLEEITGKKFSEMSLEKSIRIYNQHNDAMRYVTELVTQYPQITASQRSDIFKSAFFVAKEDHTKLLLELIQILHLTEKDEDKKIKIITSGIWAGNKSLLQILDDNKMRIVGDDVACESRQYRVDSRPLESSLDALSTKFAEMDYCSVLFDVDKKRADRIIELVKHTGANGVIIFITKFCDPEEFDYVIIKKALESANIPNIMIEVDRQMVNFEQARTMIQTFKEQFDGQY